MASKNVVDLDILRPDPVYRTINGHEFDLSFVPTGITFDVDDLSRQLSEIPITDYGPNCESAKLLLLETDPEIKKQLQDRINKATKEAVDITIKLCATFTQWKYHDMDEEWWKGNTSIDQVNDFATCIREALVRSYAGVEAYGKN